MARMIWLTWAIASLLLTKVSGQTTTDDLVGFFVSEALSVYTQVTSAIGSVQSAASAAAASSSDAAASASDAAASASATDGSSARTLFSSDFTSLFSARPSSTSATSDPTSTSRASSRSSDIGSSSRTSSSRNATAAAASATDSAGAAASSQNGSKGDKNLAIILGCVLGALALGLLILTLLLCCKRRRRYRSELARSQALSPDDQEVESWKRPGGNMHGSNKEMLGAGAAGAPLMSEHPAFRNHQLPSVNPFVPVPPPPRKSAPNARAGLTDGTVAGDSPYLTEKGSGRPLSRKSMDSSHKGRNLAMGAGALGLGAAAMHHHDKKRDQGIEVNNPYHEPIDRHRPEDRHSISRKPVPVNDALNREPWGPSPSTTANDDTFALSNSKGSSKRNSSESARSKRASRDAARANHAFNNQYAPVPDHDKDHHRGATAAAVGAAAVGGAAIAHHRGNRSRSRGRGTSHSRSPRRSLLLDAKKHVLDNSNTNSDTSGTSTSKDYTDAVPHQDMSTMSGGVGGADLGSTAGVLGTGTRGPTSPGPIDVPPAPITRSRRNSPIGTAAPAAATLSYMNTDHNARERERSGSRPRSYPHSPDDYRRRDDSPRLSGPPAGVGGGIVPVPLPSRSRGRRSFSGQRYSDNPYHQEGESFPDMPAPVGPLSSSVHSAMNQTPPPTQYQPYLQDHPAPAYSQDQPPVSTPGLQNLHTSTGIVGDNGYPHMNVPRRKSGGEYDYSSDDNFIPKVLPLPPGVANEAKERSRSRSNSMTRPAEGLSGPRPVMPPYERSETNTSDDSTWRLSMGMPGGWARNRSHSPAKINRTSYEPPVSPITEYSQRDSLMSGSTAVTGGDNGGGRRLRLADLRREEEEMMRKRGRQSMESEWVGSGGYGGYDGGYRQGGGGGAYGAERYYEGHQGVGVAR